MPASLLNVISKANCRREVVARAGVGSRNGAWIGRVTRPGCDRAHKRFIVPPMVRYEVTLEVEPSIAKAVRAFLHDKHFPEIRATGCFQHISFATASSTRYRSTYHAATEADLQRYFEVHATHLRADFVSRFPSGVTVSRETWMEEEVILSG
jgi:hypothetical protein